MRTSLSSTMIACGFAAMLSAAACSERGQMSSEGNSAASNRTPVTVTGCFQEASGFNNFVLTNITGAGSSPEQRAQGYRIERGGDIDRHIGKQVRVTGWTEGASSRPAETAGRTGHDAGDRMDFNDLPELHVENIESVGENCGNAPGASNP